MKYFLAIALFCISSASYSMNIDGSMVDVEKNLIEFSKSLSHEDVSNVKNKLASPDFSEGDEWGFDDSNPRYTLYVEEDLRLKIDTSEDGSEINTIWLQYPKNRELSPDVLSMKDAAFYVANKSLFKNKKAFKDYQKFKNKTTDSKGKANYKKMHGYTFMNTTCSTELYCITISGD